MEQQLTETTGVSSILGNVRKERTRNITTSTLSSTVHDASDDRQRKKRKVFRSILTSFFSKKPQVRKQDATSIMMRGIPATRTFGSGKHHVKAIEHEENVQDLKPGSILAT